MEGLAAVAHHGSMGAMPISRTTFHNPMGGCIFRGGAVFLRVPTRKIQVYAHEIPRSTSGSPQNSRNSAGILCWGRELPV